MPTIRSHAASCLKRTSPFTGYRSKADAEPKRSNELLAALRPVLPLPPRFIKSAVEAAAAQAAAPAPSAAASTSSRSPGGTAEQQAPAPSAARGGAAGAASSSSSGSSSSGSPAVAPADAVSSALGLWRDMTGRLFDLEVRRAPVA